MLNPQLRDTDAFDPEVETPVRRFLHRAVAVVSPMPHVQPQVRLTVLGILWLRSFRVVALLVRVHGNPRRTTPVRRDLGILHVRRANATATIVDKLYGPHLISEMQLHLAHVFYTNGCACAPSFSDHNSVQQDLRNHGPRRACGKGVSPGSRRMRKPSRDGLHDCIAAGCA